MFESALPPVVQRVRTFIENERARFHVQDNNRFAFGFSDIATYRRFLVVITARHDEASRLLQASANALSGSASGAIREMTGDEQFLFSQSQLAFELVRLETESWYLFAKILLDEVARCIEFYFGPARGLSLDSHDHLVKNFDRYAAVKELGVSEGLMDAARGLKADVADFRDYYVAHHKTPGTSRGVVHQPDKAGVRLIMFEKKQVESMHLSDLNARVDEFIDRCLDLLEANSERTKLKKRDNKA